MLREHATLDGSVVVLDLRGVDEIKPGNRFTIYSLFPEANVSVQIFDGKGKQNTVLACGHSILNRTCTADIGSLMLRYGGGGHRAVGTCQVPHPRRASACCAKSSERLQDERSQRDPLPCSHRAGLSWPTGSDLSQIVPSRRAEVAEHEHRQRPSAGGPGRSFGRPGRHPKPVLAQHSRRTREHLSWLAAALSLRPGGRSVSTGAGLAPARRGLVVSPSSRESIFSATPIPSGSCSTQIRVGSWITCVRFARRAPCRAATAISMAGAALPFGSKSMPMQRLMLRQDRLAVARREVHFQANRAPAYSAC